MPVSAASRLIALSLAAILGAAAPVLAQQRPDDDYSYAIDRPAYPPRSGPTIGIDAGHHNYHTAEGRYGPFARLETDDGFQVVTLSRQLDGEALAAIDILVIANALDASNEDNWRLPTPSAFTAAEIEAIEAWVAGGGSLLLIADHMPFAGAAADLANAFGFGFVNGYAMRSSDRATTFTFTPDAGLVLDDLGVGLPPTTHFVTFTGQAFTVPEDAIPLLVLSGPHIAVLPTVAGQIDDRTPSINVSGYAQGAIAEHGSGRVAVFGEAAAFSAQFGGNGEPMGMNAEGAEENAPFVLKILRWLARLPGPP